MQIDAYVHVLADRKANTSTLNIHYVLSFFFFVKAGKERNNISAVSCFGRAETFLNCFLLPYPFHLPLPSSPSLITCVSLLRRLARCYDFCSCSDKVTRNDNLLGWQIESSTDRLKPGWICKCVHVTGQRVHSNSHAHIKVTFTVPCKSGRKTGELEVYTAWVCKFHDDT